MADRVWVIAFWLALVFCTYSAFAPHDVATDPRISDFILHATAFFVLTGLLQLAHLPTKPLLTALCMLGYGLFIELVQHTLSSRSAELKDVWVDMVGIAAGLLGYRLFGNSVRALVRSLLP